MKPDYYENYILLYALLLFFLYMFLSISAFVAIKRYKRKNHEMDDVLLEEPGLAPWVSVIAPAFNEEKTIIVNVKSLLTLNYPNYEVVIVNDGSNDRTLNLLIEEFDLIPMEYYYHEKIKTRSFDMVYKSRNPELAKLRVATKENSRAKADALNVGINLSKHPYILCVDVDCVLERNSLLKLMKSMMNSKTKIVGVGAALRLSNSCGVDTLNGVVEEVKAPRCLIPRFQELEYLRSYLISKMGWSLWNAVPNISGALGLYDKEAVINCGGYDPDSLAEDMDLVIRLASYKINKGENYDIKYIPISGSWTEGPSDLKLLNRQRTRWARGLAQVLWKHKNKMLNYKYKKIGLVVLPSNFLFEFMAPFIEISGLIYFLYLILYSSMNWMSVLFIFLLSFSFGMLFSSLALYFDQYVKTPYKRKRDVFLVWLLLFIEVVTYHPVLVYYALRGFYQFFVSQKIEWGVMTRQGFKEERTKIIVPNH